MNVPRTLKRLLAANQLGVFFTADPSSGHRYMVCAANEVDGDNVIFSDYYWERTGNGFRGKIYGGFPEGLNYLDECLKELGAPSLEEQFDQMTCGADHGDAAWGLMPEDVAALNAEAQGARPS